MRKSSFRLTIKRLMVLVAILGLVAALESGRRRRAYFLSKAEWHMKQEDSFLTKARDQLYIVEVLSAQAREKSREASIAPNVQLDIFDVSVDQLKKVVAQSDQKRQDFTACATYHRLLHEKCRAAARFPWLSMAPDLPEPPVPLEPILPFPSSAPDLLLLPPSEP